MKRLSVDLLECVIRDVLLGNPAKAVQDIRLVRRRSSKEGPRFIDTTLKQLDEALIEGLDSGKLPRVAGWAYKGSVPSFLSPLWERVFDGSTGYLLHSASSDAIISIRQVTRTFTKVFENCSDSDIAAEVDNFIETDRGLLSRPPSGLEELARVFRIQWWHVIVSALKSAEDNMRHGPGAVSERYDSVEKSNFSHIDRRLVDSYGPEPFRATWYDLASRPPLEVEGEARLVAVPKTATKPRLICIEPAATQYVQQGIQIGLQRELSRFRAVDFSDQTRNMNMARLASIDGRFATIDLSEASDRISYKLVDTLLDGMYGADLIRSARTRLVRLPDGRALPIRKFAAMGSALTFPFECMVFFSIVSLALLGSKASRKDILSLRKSETVSVYGDDIIVPTDTAGAVMSALEQFGLKVNTKKSFFSADGRFRESCGGDYWNGVKTTPVYLRRNPDDDTWNVETLLAVISFRNQLFHGLGFSQTINFLDSLLERYGLKYHLCGGISCLDGTLCSSTQDDSVYHRPTQSFRIRAVSVGLKRPATKASDEAKLFTALRAVGSGGMDADTRRISHSSRTTRKYITRGWVSVR